VPKRLAPQLTLSLTIIVVIIAAGWSYINVRSEQRQLLDVMVAGADQLSKGIASATWHAMLADRREDAYQVMHTIALKQGIDRIRMFNRAGKVVYSTNAEDLNAHVTKTAKTCIVCHAGAQPRIEPDLPSRVRIDPAPGDRRKLAMVTPIYNEPSCSQAECHAHPAQMKVLGVLDVGLNLDAVDREVTNMKWRTVGITAVEVVLIGIFIAIFTRRFVTVPIAELIKGTQAVSAMELDRPIPIVRSSQELEHLSTSFDKMRERLRLAVSEINDFTSSLETKVEQRTEQLKAAHQKLLQSDRLASLGSLSASVAHEINNPISGVLNLAMLMQRIVKDDGIPEGRVPEFRRYLGQVISETTRVGRIVSDLLSFSRRSKPQRALADLNRIIRSTVSLIGHKMKLSNVEMEIELPADLPQALCDASQIQQVVLNLLLNGAEATNGKAERHLWVSTQAEGGRVKLLVRDNGEGIPPENLTKIFDPFFTTKSDGKGVGLGLAVSYGIIEAHGGEIEVKSKVGEGTTFIVSLPRVDHPQ
jgi:two-component system NtrC family sensor kinase